MSTPPPMVSADAGVVGGKAAEFEFMLVIRVLSNLDAESHGMLRTIAIVPNGQVTSHKMVQKKMYHFVAIFSMAFLMA